MPIFWHPFGMQSPQTIFPEVSTPFRPPATFCQPFGLGCSGNSLDHQVMKFFLRFSMQEFPVCAFAVREDRMCLCNIQQISIK